MTADLPISAEQKRILDSFAKHRSLVISAPTGSGKSTGVPVMLLSGKVTEKRIIVIEPRVIAARHLAQRVSWMLDARPGELCGHHTRYERSFSDTARIVFMTEGIFLRMLAGDPELRDVGVIIIDEFHERGILSDIALGHCKRLIDSGKGPSLIVMSATMDSSAVASYLNAPVITGGGRMFPVELRYAPTLSTAPVWEEAVRAYRSVADEPGDVLVFLPGRYEIARTIDAFRRVPSVLALPLHGDMDTAHSDRIFAPSNERKIICATNVAETALTIPTVRIVIDSGSVRRMRYDHDRGMNMLETVSASMSSAEQRRGRAGRVAPGICIRLWHERENSVRAQDDEPDIMRVDLSDAMLTLASLGYEDFPWITAPDEARVKEALDVLVMLGALERKNGLSLTAVGRTMAELPLPPRIARIAVEADGAAERDTILLWAAIASDDPVAGNDLDPLQHSGTGDLALIADIVSRAAHDDFRSLPRGISRTGAERVWRTFRQLCRMVPQGTRTMMPEQALINGFSDRVGARVPGGNSFNFGTVRATLSPKSIVRDADLVIALGITAVRDVSTKHTAYPVVPITPELLPSRSITEDLLTTFSEKDARVIASRETRYRSIVIERKEIPPDASRAAVLLAEALLEGKFTLSSWDENVDRFLTRVRCVAAWFPERGLLAYSREECAVILAEAFEGCTSVKAAANCDIVSPIRNALSYDDRSFIERMAPEAVTLANGRVMKIMYQEGKPPRARMKLQHLYDVPRTPTVAGGKVRVLLEILAPNQRPVQITDDLAGFWANSYIQIRKELAGRYPKHEWR